MIGKLKNPNKKHPHHTRTHLAAFFGVVAVVLVLASIFGVWLYRNTTDTKTYVDTVAPLASQPEVQEYVAQLTTDSIIEKIPSANLAAVLLPPAELAGKTPAQLSEAIEPLVKENVVQVVSSSEFADLWRDSNRQAHEAFISQIDSEQELISLNLQPLIVGVIQEVQKTKLAPLTLAVPVTENTGRLDIKGNSFNKARDFHKLATDGTFVLIFVTILSLAASVILSVHHAKTLRRIALGTGIVVLIWAALLRSASYFKLPGGDPVEQNAASAVAKTLFSNLETASLIIGLTLVASVIVSKLYSKKHTKK